MPNGTNGSGNMVHFSKVRQYYPRATNVEFRSVPSILYSSLKNVPTLRAQSSNLLPVCSCEALEHGRRRPHIRTWK